MLKTIYFSTLTVLAVAALLTSGAHAEVSMDMTYVGNPGNAADDTGYGAVAYGYGISEYEVTVAQYTEFLNAVAADDTHALYSASMGGTGGHRTGIVQSGSPGSNTYSVEASKYADKPVSFVSLQDAMRFANWMHNGQPIGVQNATSTEDGAYTITGAETGADWYAKTRNAYATWVLPTEQEWYKAAYHMNDGVTGNYWDYPTRSDTLPSNVLVNPDLGNNATYYDVYGATFTLMDGAFGTRTVVGEHEYSASSYGTFDQGGNVVELHEGNGNYMIAHGGGYAQNWDTLQSSVRMGYQYIHEYLDLGFRVGNLTYDPEPAPAAWKMGDPIVTYYSSAPHDETMAQAAVDGSFNLIRMDTSASWESQAAIHQAYGLRTMLESYWLKPEFIGRAELDALIDAYKVHPTAYAYFLDDEPSATKFAGLAALKSYILERDPDHLVYINLADNTFSTAALGAPSHQAYIDQYLSIVQPQLISYDHYSFMTWGDLPSYFSNLATFRLAAKRAGVPFMNVVQAMSWDNPASSVNPYRLPDANELRFLNYTTLAYGGQGISYFNYWRFEGSEGGIEPYPDGSPTSVYTALQSINPQFLAIAKQLQSRTSVGAYHLGDQPPGTVRLPGNSPFTLSPTVPDTTYVTNEPVNGVLMGLFGPNYDIDDSVMALIVNLDYENSVTTTVNGPGLLSVFDADTDTWTATGQTWAELNLEPGGGILVGLTYTVSPMPGDANRDGQVNAADAEVMATNWLASDATWDQGDFDGDGQVNDTDATVLATNWLRSFPGGTASVPEPTAIALLLGGSLCLLAGRRRRIN